MRTSNIKINVNDYVRVRLTDRGRELHRRNYEERWSGRTWRPDYVAPVEDASGWSRWQLWVLMQEFGPHIVPEIAGVEPPFRTEIDLEKAQVAEKKGSPPWSGGAPRTLLYTVVNHQGDKANFHIWPRDAKVFNRAISADPTLEIIEIIERPVYVSEADALASLREHAAGEPEDD